MTPKDEAFLKQLNKAYAEYRDAKTQYEIARTDFEATREKFKGLSVIGEDVVTPMPWWTWQRDHNDVRFFGKSIGEAILEVLRGHASDNACDIIMGGKHRDEYHPQMSLHEIAEGLEAGGFEFRSSTARREVNAALLQLKGVSKDRSGYTIDDAEELFDNTEFNLSMAEDQAGAEQSGEAR